MPIQSFNTAETHMNNLIHSYHQTANSKDEIIMHLTEILDNLNYFHPFREGNGRTQQNLFITVKVRKIALNIKLMELDVVKYKFMYLRQIGTGLFILKVYMFKSCM